MHMSKHMMPQNLNKEFMNFKKMLINFRNEVSDIIPFVYVGKEEIVKYM